MGLLVMNSSVSCLSPPSSPSSNKYYRFLSHQFNSNIRSSSPSRLLMMSSSSSSGAATHHHRHRSSTTTTKYCHACHRELVGNTKITFCYGRSGEATIEKTHSMAPQKLEIFKSLEGWAEHNMLMHLKPVDRSWQPSDFLPEPESEEFQDQVKELRERCRELPDEYLVVLVGDMITEEAIPTYQSVMNSLDGVGDETGASLSPWAVWIRAWSAEENRHGDLLNKYLYLSGRVDMKQIEKTIQYLISSGMDAKFENNPYNGFIYTSFQERATFISHGNTAKLAKNHGDLKLAQICGTIAADEKRHETAYTKVVEKLFEIDPNETIQALAATMRKKIKMPAQFLYDGQDDNLFKHYSAVAQRLGVYTAKDYADILEFLVGKWGVEKLSSGLSGEGRRAQDFVCGLPLRIRKLEERALERTKSRSSIDAIVPFSWVFGREIEV